MDFALQPRFYAHVPVWLWPWVLWQILRVMAWSDESGRAVSFSINESGQLYVNYVADDPRLWNEFSMRRYTRPLDEMIAALSRPADHVSSEAAIRNPLSPAGAQRLSAGQNHTPRRNALVSSEERHNPFPTGAGPPLKRTLPRLVLSPHPELVEGRGAKDEEQRLAPHSPQTPVKTGVHLPKSPLRPGGEVGRWIPALILSLSKDAGISGRRAKRVL